MKILQFSNVICAILCILFGYISNRRKDHHLHDSPFYDNLNRINIRSSNDRYGLILEYIKYRSYIFSHHLNLSSVTVFSPAFSVSSSSLPAFKKKKKSFFKPPLRVFKSFDSSKGVFYTDRPNTSFSVSCSPLPFFPFSPLFFLLFSLSFLPAFPFLSLPADFWCGDRRHAAPLPTGLDQSISGTCRLWGILQSKC